jgi:hypothetical protein
VLLSVTEFIGRFHPLLVHLPIGILLLALVLQWLSRKEQYTLAHGVMKVVWISGASASLLSCITGYMLSLNGEYETDLVAIHMWLGIAVTAVSLLICAKVFSLQFDIIYKTACIVLIILIFATGHFGGSLTHGSDYLSSAFSDDTDSVTVQKIIPNIQEANVYGDVVQPLLQSKCYGCHGPKKQKGNLRMDNPEYLMKGGKEGETIIAGKADESEMIKRLLLAREAEHHMPPKEKPQLNERQIALLHWWIEEGADFTKKVKELPQPEKMKPVLLSMQGKPEEKALSTVPSIAVERADAKAINVLRDRGVVVIPVAQNSNYLQANFITATNIFDEDIKLLLPIKKQLVWLKLGSTYIGDSALKFIGQCTNISFLQLNNTCITDGGLPFLKSLDSLQSLNIVGTIISADGLMHLSSLKKLKSIYVYQTPVKEKNIEVLRKTFPKTIIDTGGYTIPFLANDTMIVKAPHKS